MSADEGRHPATGQDSNAKMNDNGMEKLIHDAVAYIQELFG